MESNTYIKPSLIHGLGLFAAEDIKAGDLVIQGNPNYSDFWDEWAWYNKTAGKKSFQFMFKLCMVNHNDKPNTERNKDYEIIAIKDIPKGSEITEDYHKLPDHENPFKSQFGAFIEDFLLNKYK